MDLIDVLNGIVSRIPKLIDTLQTEEATKNALIMPFIQAIGYNVFDPFEVVPEFTADVGTKKNEKIDYAIIINGDPSILIECKSSGSELNLKHASQLYRYFTATKARFAILTNGIDYQFFTDIEQPNIMDDRPFFEFSMIKLEPKHVNEIKKFSKSLYNENNILSNASELKYKKQIRRFITDEYNSPSDEFVRLFAKRVYDGVLTPDRKDQFTTLVGSAFREWVNNRINERLQSAIEGSDQSPLISSNQQASTISESLAPSKETDDGIITTEEEMEAFRIVRSILSQEVAPSRIVMRDTKSYCGVLLDDNNRKPLCRFLFRASGNSIIFVDKERREEKIPLTNILEIYTLQDRLREIPKNYILV